MAIYRMKAGASAAPAAPAAAVAAAPTAPMVSASKNESESPRPEIVWGSMSVVIVGAIVGWILYKSVKPADFIPKSDYSVFAGLFILAAALERLLEPFSNLIPPKTDQTKKDLEAAVETANNSQNDAAIEAEAIATDNDEGNTAAETVAHTTIDYGSRAADQQAKLDRQRTERSFLLWAAATVLAILGCAGTGAFMLRAVADVPRCDPKSASTVTTTDPSLKTPQGCTANDPNRFFDLVLTGLVVGAGTKPLHELISGVQAKKEAVKDPPETKGA